MTSKASSNIDAVKTRLSVHLLAWDLELTTFAGHSVLWENGFNKTHRAKIFCYNGGGVVGKTWDIEKPCDNKFWWISDLSDSIPASTLSLTLDESIEYVRHWIWANHNV